MLTRRDLLVGAAAAAMTLTAVAAMDARRDVMGSRIFEWNTLKAVPNKTGSVRKVVQQPTATLDELEMHITTLNAGETSHAPHQHPQEEVIIVKEGTLESLVNGELKRIGPGSIVFQASNQLHGIRNVGNGPATYHVIQWQPPGMMVKK